MIGNVRKFEGNTTMSFKISNEQLLKKEQSNMEKSWKIIENRIWYKSVYGDNDKYIKPKIKIYNNSTITNFQSKKMLEEKAPLQVLVNNNVRFCCQCKKKYYSETLLEEC